MSKQGKTSASQKPITSADVSRIQGAVARTHGGATPKGSYVVFHDKTGLIAQGETDLALDQFPGPGLLWAKYREWKGLSAAEEQIVLEPYYDDGSGKEPRYYQRNAINAAVEAIAKGQDRVLLVMATGTGKTYTAFQIIWRLWKSNWHTGRQKRVLFLADRNILVDQTMVNDFRPFGAKMAKLSTQAKTIERDDGTKTELTVAVDKNRRIDTAYEIYLGLYQALTGPEDRQKLFRELSPVRLHHGRLTGMVSRKARTRTVAAS